MHKSTQKWVKKGKNRQKINQTWAENGKKWAKNVQNRQKMAKH